MRPYNSFVAPHYVHPHFHGNWGLLVIVEECEVRSILIRGGIFPVLVSI